MGAVTKDRPSGAQLREMKATREAAEAAKIAEAHAALGTDTGSIDEGPQDVHDGDPDETGEAQTAIPEVGKQVPMSRFVVGGKKPTTQSLRLLGGKIDLPLSGTPIEKGDSLVLTVEVRVKGVNHVDEEDSKTGQVIGCDRRIAARITGMEVR